MRSCPQYVERGTDLTIVGSSYSTLLASQAAFDLRQKGYSIEVIDLRVLNPFNPNLVVESVKKTGRLLVVDGGWQTCGMASEVIAAVVRQVEPSLMKKSPSSVTLPSAPAPTSRVLEQIYYPTKMDVFNAALTLLK